MRRVGVKGLRGLGGGLGVWGFGGLGVWGGWGVGGSKVRVGGGGGAGS